MKTAGLSLVIAALLVGAHAVPQCNYENPIEDPSLDLGETLHNAINGPIEKFCGKGFKDGETVISTEEGHSTFRIVKEDTGEEIHSSEGCPAAFHAIVAECVDKHNVWGGEVSHDGLVYTIHPY